MKAANSGQRPSRPCFWYLVIGVLFALAGYQSVKHVPHLMERFRPADGGLLPVPFISMKQTAAFPAWIAAALFVLFLASFLRSELHGATAIKLTSAFLILFLLGAVAQLLMALAIAGGLL